MQAWWAAESVMLTQGSIGSAWAGGMQRGASAMAAAADAPSIALFISSFPDPLMAAVLSPPTQCRTLCEFVPDNGANNYLWLAQ